METLTQDQLDRFSQFTAAYDEARIWLIGAGGGPETIARNILDAALTGFPLMESELELYKVWLRGVRPQPEPNCDPNIRHAAWRLV